MTHRLLYIMSAIALLSSIAAEGCDECGADEVVNPDPSNCKNDCCPTNPGECSACSGDCDYKPCICGLMSRRAVNGTCISTRDCPPIDCPENEKYDPCPVCSEECSNKSPTGKRCKFIGHLPVVICDPKCRCIDNYWRNNGVCVPYDECP